MMRTQPMILTMLAARSFDPRVMWDRGQAAAMDATTA